MKCAKDAINRYNPLMAIEADQLCIRRLDKFVLQDISLRIEAGECVSIIGPNGAGKSTLMAALLGLLPKESGGIFLDGERINRLSRRRIARLVGYVPQIHEGYQGFQVKNIVESGRYAYLDPLDSLGEEDHQAVAEAVRASRIEHLLHRRLDTLSGGERQKVWIAAALAQQTPYLFLDEPTNALDPAHQAELIRIMQDYSAAGKTLLVICHDLNLPLILGGRVIALRDGAVTFDGPTTNLTDLDLLKTLFGTEFDLYQQGDGDRISVQLRVR